MPEVKNEIINKFLNDEEYTKIINSALGRELKVGDPYSLLPELKKVIDSSPLKDNLENRILKQVTTSMEEKIEKSIADYEKSEGKTDKNLRETVFKRLFSRKTVESQMKNNRGRNAFGLKTDEIKRVNDSLEESEIRDDLIEAYMETLNISYIARINAEKSLKSNPEFLTYDDETKDRIKEYLVDTFQDEIYQKKIFDGESYSKIYDGIEKEKFNEYFKEAIQEAGIDKNSKEDNIVEKNINENVEEKNNKNNQVKKGEKKVENSKPLKLSADEERWTFAVGIINAYNNTETPEQYNERALISADEQIKRINALLSRKKDAKKEVLTNKDHLYTEKEVSDIARLLKFAEELSNSETLNSKNKNYLQSLLKVKEVKDVLDDLQRDFEKDGTYMYELKYKQHENIQNGKLPTYDITDAEKSLGFGGKIEENTKIESSGEEKNTETINNESQEKDNQEQENVKENEKIVPEEVEEEKVIESYINIENQFDNLYTDYFDEIVKNINDAASSINSLLEVYAEKYNKELKGEKLKDKMHNLYEELSDEEKDEFAKQINPYLENLKNIKEENSKLYTEAVIENGKNLNKLAKDILDSSNEIKRLEEIYNEVKVLEDEAKEIAENLSSIEEEKQNLIQVLINKGEESKTDPSSPDYALSEYDEKINSLTEKAAENSSKIAQLYPEGIFDLATFEAQLNSKKSDLEFQTEKYEKAEKGFLDASNEVRNLLYNRGIKIDLYGRSEVPFDDLEKQADDIIEDKEYSDIQTDDVIDEPIDNKKTQNQTEKINQNSNGEKQFVNNTNNNVNQQTKSNPASSQIVNEDVLPSTIIDENAQLDRNIIEIINDGNIWDRMVDHRHYNNVMKNFEEISNSNSKLSMSQKKQLRDAFRRSAKKASIDMQDLDAKTINTIKDIIGKENFDLIQKEIRGKGKFLKNKSNGFAGVSQITKDAMLNSASMCYSKIKNGELSEEEINIINSNLLKPLRFSVAQRNCEALAGNKLLNFFRHSRDNAKVNYLEETLSNITDELEQNGFVPSVQSSFMRARPEDRQLIQDEVQKSDSKSFKDYLKQEVRNGNDLEFNVEVENINIKDIEKNSKIR